VISGGSPRGHGQNAEEAALTLDPASFGDAAREAHEVRHGQHVLILRKSRAASSAWRGPTALVCSWNSFSTPAASRSRSWASQGRRTFREIYAYGNRQRRIRRQLTRADGHDYTVLGDSVNLAARLVAAAAPGQTLLSEGVFRALGGLGVCESIGELPLKGIDATVR
jgi:class 3 adenylate cyclase